MDRHGERPAVHTTFAFQSHPPNGEQTMPLRERIAFHLANEPNHFDPRVVDVPVEKHNADTDQVQMCPPGLVSPFHLFD